jgi:hypothetical protein
VVTDEDPPEEELVEVPVELPVELDDPPELLCPAVCAPACHAHVAASATNAMALCFIARKMSREFLCVVAGRTSAGKFIFEAPLKAAERRYTGPLSTVRPLLLQEACQRSLGDSIAS